MAVSLPELEQVAALGWRAPDQGWLGVYRRAGFNDHAYHHRVAPAPD